MKSTYYKLGKKKVNLLEELYRFKPKFIFLYI